MSDDDQNNGLTEPLLTTPTPSTPKEDEAAEDDFCVKAELIEMANLGIPLAVSFFCRMGMASTDSSFVGHINDGIYTPEVYLAAAVLSDLVVNVLIVPPLAFNQVLNALVGQAMGSGNPKMAGIWLQQSMFWFTVASLPFLIGFFYVEVILKNFLGFPADVSRVAGVYAKYNLLWPIPNGLYQCMRFYFQAQGKPRPAMYNNLLFLFVNAFLNWLLVMGGPFRGYWNGFGFVGAAMSLSCSRTLQPVVYYLYMFAYKKEHLETWPGLSFKHHTKARTIEFMKQSLPNIGTLLFQTCASQATTVLVGRLGERAIASSSALSTVSIPWSGTLSATCGTISGVRVGYHLGRGKAYAAKRTANLVLYLITAVNVAVAFVFLPLRHAVMHVATSDDNVIELSALLVPAMLVGTYLNLLVSNITSGVFSGMGRPIIATILSFGFELPMSIGGVAIYILLMHGNLQGVYWWNAISGGLEVIVVLGIMLYSDWKYWADQAQLRQEAARNNNTEEEQNDAEAPSETEALVAADNQETPAES